jgi:thiosulfate dehydrogenase [quinone] large subunit
MAPFWTVVRVYLGWLWLNAGWHKVTDPKWVGAEAGTAVSGFLNRALSLSVGDSPAVSGWYAWLVENVFLPAAPLMSYLVAFGELLVGVALIAGFLTGLVAFLGGLMNVAFMLAGTLSTNPVMFILATWIVLAWRIAGYYGLDYWVLPLLGAPANGFSRRRSAAAGSTVATS